MTPKEAQAMFWNHMLCGDIARHSQAQQTLALGSAALEWLQLLAFKSVC